MESIRVFLADDHELVRYGLRSMFDGEDDLSVVGEAADGASTVSGCDTMRPDVLVLDLRMPGPGGAVVCRAVRDTSPGTAVLVLTSFDEDEELFEVLSAGACGYLLKDTRPDRIIHAIRAVADGQAVFDSAVASRVITGRPRVDAALESSLSEREIEVLGLMSKGLSNREIAQTLWIGEATVKTHVSHILRKLGQTDRTGAVLTAVKAGLVRLDG